MAKKDDEQHPCVKEVSKAVVHVQSDCYSETGQRLLPTYRAIDPLHYCVSRTSCLNK